MNFNYEEIGTFDAQKAAKGLIELTNTIKKNDKDNNKKQS